MDESSSFTSIKKGIVNLPSVGFGNKIIEVYSAWESVVSIFTLKL
jgi:hypothetical protein